MSVFDLGQFFRAGSLALALLSLAPAPASAALATRTINYQGQLTDLGDNIVNTPQNMAFELYNAAVGGTQVHSWAQTSVPVQRGLFNVELPIPALSADQLNGELWLQVTVAGNLMSPRKQVLTGVFALNADRLQGFEPGSGPGQIPVILTATGKLDPAVLSAPFPLTVSGNGAGSGAAGIFVNQDAGAGQAGLRAFGHDAGAAGTATGPDGAGLRGQAHSADSAAGTGVLGAAVNGVGVRAQADAAGTVALQALNPQGLGLFAGSGLWGAQLGGSLLGLRIGGAGLGGQSAQTPQTGLEINSLQQGLVVNNAGSAPAISSLNTGVGVAIEGKVSSANGVGLRGEHFGLGFGTGVWGLSNAAGGTGVRGEHGGSGGDGVGVSGSSGSPDGTGVSGSGPGTGVRGSSTGAVAGANRVGVLGTAAAPGGTGVRGEASGGGAAYGVYGLAPASATGAGVHGQSPLLGVQGVATDANSAAVGVRGSAGAKGVQGLATQAGGALSVGVEGSSASPDGTGVRGLATAGGAGVGVGVRGESSSSQGVGVEGQGPAAGVRGRATSGFGRGVDGDGGPAGAGIDRAGLHGSVSLAPGEKGYGIYGTVNGATGDGYAVYAFANAPGHRALRAYNSEAKANLSGYALGVEGKFKVGTDNAGFHPGPAAAVSSWLVSCDYCGVGDVVLVSPAMDITAGGAVANALWVAPGDVSNGSFTARSAAPVAGMRFNYLVIDRD